MNKLKVKDLLKVYEITKKVYVIKEVLINEIEITQTVRNYCIQNKCEQYGANYMCPPYVGGIEEFKKKLKTYNVGFIVIVKDNVNDPNDMKEFYKPAYKLHEIMLELEEEVKKLGFENSYALIGGNCKLCKVCNAKLGIKKCNYPNKARPSLEAMGIDVINTCKKIGINIEFRKDEVTWVGLLLI
ncbi:DUF2284 domain-containing protein [Caloranaerobacter sp. TR13]|uniref:DUF2284 domain-containing protein n=1 Tax=Caloranaerobacter sp. TR13 TaxID=1302151 RepID=UPI0006D45B57|nr:DUF2284 domain-containing protein [Caloranaerobacter sp. TR13]